MPKQIFKPKKSSIMFKFFSQPYKEYPGESEEIPEEIQESINPYPPEINITEGSEFLDDAIRMEDQPLGIRGSNENI
jgi:hypothetical protein